MSRSIYVVILVPREGISLESKDWICSAGGWSGRSVQWRCPVPEPPEASLGELRTGVGMYSVE